MTAMADMQGEKPPHDDEQPTCDLSEEPIAAAVSLQQKRRERAPGGRASTVARSARAAVKRAPAPPARSPVTRLAQRTARSQAQPDPRGEVTQIIEKTTLLPPPAPAAHPRAPIPPVPSLDSRSAAATLLRAAGLSGNTGPREEAPARGPESAGDPPGAAAPAGQWLRHRYELLMLLGRGGMASVYKAIDHDRMRLGLDDSTVALKVVEANASRPTAVSALLQEFQSAQRLSHPNVINVYDIDRDGERTFYSMELLSGARLSQVLRSVDGAPLDRRWALTIIRDIGAAIVHAHSRGVVHGDLKPSNVMITQAGDVRVLDFGGQSLPPKEPWISAGDGDDVLHHATPAYASCEQLERQRADPRDDTYALACVAYLLLTGKHPFDYLPSLEARARGLRPQRPAGLSGRQWQALRQALAWAREDRPTDLAPWLARLGLAAAAGHLPPLADLTAPAAPPSRGTGAGLLAALAGMAAAALVALVVARSDEVESALSSWTAPAWQWLELHAPASGPVRVPDQPPAAAVHADSQPVPAAPAVAATATARETPAPRAATPAAASVKDDAPAVTPSAPHVAFASAEYRVPTGEPAARIVIQRAPGSSGDLSFIWWTSAGTAVPDVDYASLGARTEHLPAGQDRVTVFVPVISNPLRRSSLRFEVVLTDSASHRGPSAAPSARSSVVIEAGR